MSVIEQEKALRARMREKARQQAQLIRWQNDRIVALEQQVDRLKATTTKHDFMQDQLTRRIAKLQRHAENRQQSHDQIKSAAIRAGVWGLVVDELRLAREE